LLKYLISGFGRACPARAAPDQRSWLAPTSFGRFGGALLVGNFGNGHINAYDPRTGLHLGRLEDKDGNAIVINGLWGIAFGNGVDAQPTNELFYAAGPGEEMHGGYGVLKSVPLE